MVLIAQMPTTIGFYRTYKELKPGIDLHEVSVCTVFIVPIRN